MQAIKTKYLPATNKTDARIIASAKGGTKIITWDGTLDQEANHRAAAIALCEVLDWMWILDFDDKLASGILPSGEHCHVFTTKFYKEGK